MQQHPALVGRNALTRRAIRWERAVVIRARGCRLAPRSVHGLGEPLGAGLLPVRHDHTGLDAWGPACDRDDHAARAPPRAGLGTRRVEAGALAPESVIADHAAQVPSGVGLGPLRTRIVRDVPAGTDAVHARPTRVGE